MDAETFVKSRITPEQIVRLVRAFQLQNDLKVDGKPGPITLSRVDEILTSTTPTEPPEAPEIPDLSLSPDKWLYGIDIDHHQRVDGDALDANLAQFAFVGVSEGTGGRASTDPKFIEHLTELSSVNVRALGVYHFARPSSARLHGPNFGQPLGEAENFARQWDAAAKLVSVLLPPVLDMEDEKEQLSNEELVAWTLEWCEHCTRLTGRRPIIYTYFSFIHSHLKGYAGTLDQYQLWLADYRNAPPNSPREISGWPWLFWQFSGTGKVPGIKGDCDRNVFRGTKGQLEGLLL